MNYLDEVQRSHILKSALSARTPEQLERATQELDTWVIAHPDDMGIQWAYEQMGLVELALQETESTPLAALAKAS